MKRNIISIIREEFVTKERFANGRVCPVCGATHVVRNGKRKDGTQKYICKDCGKSFVITTNSIVSGTRWHNFVDYAKESDVEKRAILLSYVLITLKTDRNSSLSDRPALPFVA